MQIKNPSNNAIENVKIYGISYSIEAEGTLDNVPEAHARYWQESLHKFLVLRKDKLETVKAEVVIEIPLPKVTELELHETKEEEEETEKEVLESIPVVKEKKNNKVK